MVQDLNLVSQLNYNVQPLQQTPVHLCKIIREIVVEYLNSDINNKFEFELNLDRNAEQITIIGDEDCYVGQYKILFLTVSITMKMAV